MDFAYLTYALLFVPIWTALFLLRKDLRREMFFVGALVTIGELYGEAFIWTKDWWLPHTITGTLLGIEDVIIAFFWGGIMAVVYEVIFREKLVSIRKKDRHHLKHFALAIASMIIVGNITFFIFNMHSFGASILSMLAAILVIYYYRKDLILLSLGTGGLITIISIPIYIISFYLHPDFINVWFLKNFSGVLFVGIPIEDLIWIFVAGMLISPLYEFWKGDTLKNI